MISRSVTVGTHMWDRSLASKAFIAIDANVDINHHSRRFSA